MGRRSINTTKSGKYMNPTDQARKEARKRELRKNKKQRTIVRAAVLKGKDPFQIIADMERLDQMEYNVNTPPPLNEKVLRDKRRKMRETWDRLCRLYAKDDHEKYVELKRLEVEYEGKRNQLVKFYEAVKSTEEVEIDDIPLPSAPMDPSSISMPSFSTSMESMAPNPSSILRKPHNLSAQIVLNKEPPGVPSGPPPVLSDIEDDDSGDEEIVKTRKIRFNEDPSNEKDADINEFLKEIDQVEKARIVKPPQQLHHPSLPGVPPSGRGATILPPPIRGTNMQGPPPGPPPPGLMMVRPPHNQFGPPGAVRPPPVNPGNVLPQRPGFPAGMGPPPPLPVRPGMPPPPRISGPQLGPPNPRMMQVPPQHQGARMHHPPPSSFPGPASTVSRRDDKKTHIISDRATIEAKPQLRNLSADATRFTPVALRVKREDKVPKKLPQKTTGFEAQSYGRYGNVSGGKSASMVSAPTKDDAYEQFMKEMQGMF